MTDLSTASPVPDELVARIPPLVDLDAHVVEPPGTWSDRLPAALVDRGPRIELHPAGTPRLSGTTYIEEPGTEGPDVAWWHFEDQLISLKRTIAAAGYPADEVELKSVGYDDMRPGCWQPGARVEDMDLNGVEAQLCFPNLPRFCGQLFLWAEDRELGLACVRAYNDWMVEEWCGSSGGRLLPLTLVPLWDARLAADEVRRNADRGVRAVAFSELPTYLGLPSIYTGHWDPFFAACQETGTVVAMHIGSGTKTPRASDRRARRGGRHHHLRQQRGRDGRPALLGVFHRFPGLKVLFAEAQIGWIPYVLERADDVWLTHRGWSNSQLHCPEPPSTYYRDHVFSCFFKDAVGVSLLDQVGEDNVVFETDYPHQDGTWPHSRQAAAEQFGHLDQTVIDKIARGNAIRLLGLDL